MPRQDKWQMGNRMTSLRRLPRPECQQERDIGLVSAWSLDGVASRQQEMRELAEIVHRADIELGIGLSTYLAGGLVEYFYAQGEGRGQLTLPLPAHKPRVAILSAGVDPIPPATVGRPRPDTLLQPEREKSLDVPTAQASLVVTGREL